jgi:AcrR family transcriptional regulator
LTQDVQKDTKKKILDAAERLFADHGFDASLRSITSEADVNLASVNYHFGSKDALIEAVFARRLVPLNRERFEMLDRIEAEEKDRPPLDRVLEAFVAPPLRLFGSKEYGGEVFMRLMGRAMIDPGERLEEIFLSQFREVAERFVAALRRARPELPVEDVLWRLFFSVGAMAHAMAQPQRLKVFSHGLCDPNDIDAMIRRLVAFLTAGMSAPATQEERP